MTTFMFFYHLLKLSEKPDRRTHNFVYNISKVVDRPMQEISKSIDAYYGYSR